MNVFLQRSIALLSIIVMTLTLTSCSNDDDDRPQNVYYAYYEFSDDIFELYNISIRIIDENLDELEGGQTINPDKPYKVDENNHRKSFLIKCDGKGRRGVTFICKVKSAISHEELKNSDKTYNIMYGYSYRKHLKGETEEEATTNVMKSCRRKTKTISSEELAAEPEIISKDTNALIKYEAIINEIENALYKLF
ncbi:MAG: hypothetical protein J5663_09710 [Bacteroidaceae bacterium]|nr:hypothetical protein [Bacteroidaceae bacterium]